MPRNSEPEENGPSKVDPRLAAAKTIAEIRGGGGDGLLDVFVEFGREPTAEEAAVLRACGAPMPAPGEGEGAVLTARLTPEAIDAVAALGSVLRIAASATMRPVRPME